MQAFGQDAKPDAQKIALHLTAAGPQTVEVFTMQTTKRISSKVVQKFDKHCSPKKKETFKHCVLCSCAQFQTESFKAFVMDLKLKARSCNFGELKAIVWSDCNHSPVV